MSSRSATNAAANDPSSPSPEPNQSFPKSRRLLRRADFQRVYDGGTKIVGPFFLLFVRHREEEGPCRIGLTASRKVGKAVVRNRAKRLVREAVRRNWEATPHDCDCIIHFRARVREATYAAIEEDLLRTMRRARATLKEA
ncbi:MAG: ribonuclease P protein component [Bryobacterales bacterium]